MLDLNDLQCTTNDMSIGHGISTPDKDYGTTVYPGIKITSGEQYVPMYLALELKNGFTPSPSLKLLEKKQDNKLYQAKLKSTFAKEWFAYLQENLPKEYTFIVDNKWGDIRTKVKRNLFNWYSKEVDYDTLRVRLGLAYFKYVKEYYTLGTKLYEGVVIEKANIAHVFYLVLVKAKVLPLITTNILLNQPYKLDISDIKVLTNWIPGNSYSGIIQTEVANVKLPGYLQPEPEQTTLEHMLKYLIGEQAELTQEDRLKKAIELSELVEDHYLTTEPIVSSEDSAPF